MQLTSTKNSTPECSKSKATLVLLREDIAQIQAGVHTLKSANNHENIIVSYTPLDINDWGVLTFIPESLIAVVLINMRHFKLINEQYGMDDGNRTLRHIHNSIEDVVTVSEESSQVFASVSSQIQETNNLVLQMKSAMDEMDVDAHRISDHGNILADISEKMGLTIDDISARLNQFKT